MINPKWVTFKPISMKEKIRARKEERSKKQKEKEVVVLSPNDLSIEKSKLMRKKVYAKKMKALLDMVAQNEK